MCPHGVTSQPETCSQCLSSRARKIEILEGRVFIDGIDNGSMIERMKATVIASTQPTRTKICSNCHLPGHWANTCNVVMEDYE